MIDWHKIQPESVRGAADVAERFRSLGLNPINNDWTGLIMDIQATTIEVPLDFPALLSASVNEFSHDVVGINENLNRTTGKLGDGFVPRFSLSPDAPSLTSTGEAEVEEPEDCGAPSGP